MSAQRCPKCNLVNMEDARRCRRCSTPLSPGNGKDIADSKSSSSGPKARRLVIPAVAVAALLCLWGFYKHANGGSKLPAEATVQSKTMVTQALANETSVPVNPKLDAVQKLDQDFIAQLDKNMNDRDGDGLKKDQALAYDTMMRLKEHEAEVMDPRTEKFRDEFSRLVEKYYNQLVQYNSETDHDAELNQKLRSQIGAIRQETSLSQAEEFIKERDVRRTYYDETQRSGVKYEDLNETVKSLHALSASNAGSQQ
jgi:hypothetical protein